MVATRANPDLIRIEPAKAPRLYYLDWARVFAFCLLIVFHTGLIYTPWPWHMKSEVFSPPIEHLAQFLTQWRIPLLFFISGGGTALAYKGRYLAFVQGRVLRVLIPLVTAILFILPLQHLLERHWQGAPLSVLKANPLAYFTGIQPKGNFSFYHLWYLWDLWRMSLVLVPALFLLNSRIADRFRNANFRYAFAGLGLVSLALIKGAPAYGIMEYAVEFAMGYLVFANISRFEFRRPIAALVVMVLSYAVLVGYFWKHGYATMPPHIVDWPLVKWLYRLLLMLMTLAMIYAVMALFKTYFNRPNATVAYMNRIIVPIYVLHQLLVMGIGYAFVKNDVQPLLAFVAIQAIFWPVVLALCWIIDRVPALRWVMGVR